MTPVRLEPAASRSQVKHSTTELPIICFLKSSICILATGEISIFLLVSVAEETGLKLALSETPKTGFLATRPIYFSIIHCYYSTLYPLVVC